MSKCEHCKSGYCAAYPVLKRCPVPDTPAVCLFEDKTDWRQAFIDERDRYDRLVDFELAEAAELAKLKANTQNVVIVEFPGGNKKYLYSLPERINLRKGQRVLVGKHNTGIATVYRNSFRVGGDALNALVDIMGATLPLKSVIGMRFGDE